MYLLKKNISILTPYKDPAKMTAPPMRLTFLKDCLLLEPFCQSLFVSDTEFRGSDDWDDFGGFELVHDSV